MIVKWVTVKFFEQVEGDVRLVFQQRVAYGIQLTVQADGVDLMAHALQGRDYVVLGLDLLRVFAAHPAKRFRRDQIFVHQHDNAQFLFRLEVGIPLHTAIRW
jgi:hypothetical protein